MENDLSNANSGGSPRPNSGNRAAGIVVVFVAIALAGAVVRGALLAKGESKLGAYCAGNLRRLVSAMGLYVEDWSGRYPPSGGWNVVAGKSWGPEVLNCPKASSTQPSYGMNARLSGAIAASAGMPSNTVVLFDSLPGRNVAGGPEKLASPPRHQGSNNLVFADGHLQSIAPDLVSMVWNTTTQPSPVQLPASRCGPSG